MLAAQSQTTWLKRLSVNTQQKLAHLGIQTVGDLLFHLPLHYQDRTTVYPLYRLPVGKSVLVDGIISHVTKPQHGRTRLLVRLEDGHGLLNLRFFYLSSFQQRLLAVGTALRCFGEVRLGSHGLEMIHPEWRLQNEEQPMVEPEHLTPIYPTTDGLKQQTLRRLVNGALDKLVENGLHELIPISILQKFAFPSLEEALKFVHRPPPHVTVSLLEQGLHPAQQRLAFEELLAHRLSLLQIKTHFQQQEALPLPGQGYLVKHFLNHLPFVLTNSQQRVTAEIYQDLIATRPMLRLVQGDVGSGKTVVAVQAILQAVENGFQAAFMAPTELLAEQHFFNLQRWLTALGITVVFLGQRIKGKARSQTLQAIMDGTAAVIVGTHALFQKEVVFAKLALIVVDEQHRFGVVQRAKLREKGMQGRYCPHQLLMTATPIPRTLAMSIYADIDCSTIDELPPGRTPVTTIVLPNLRRTQVITRIRSACQKGQQVYWVCTLVEESEELQCEAAEAVTTSLQQTMPELVIGLIHGRMKSEDKEQLMKQFKQGQIQLLVATTVIEVGVDVPNASLMVIENAERLGLAQLHQLRGRVGRGSAVSFCVLLYQNPLSEAAKKRLSIMRQTTDGFKIAEKDLEIRGPGEVLGTRQTGAMSFKIANLIRDYPLLPAVQETAAILIKEHSQVVERLIQRWLGDKSQYGRV